MCLWCHTCPCTVQLMHESTGPVPVHRPLPPPKQAKPPAAPFLPAASHRLTTPPGPPRRHHVLSLERARRDIAHVLKLQGEVQPMSARRCTCRHRHTPRTGRPCRNSRNRTQTRIGRNPPAKRVSTSSSGSNSDSDSIPSSSSSSTMEPA